LVNSKRNKSMVDIETPKNNPTKLNKNPTTVDWCFHFQQFGWK
jgi:hypothetical protein